MAHESGTPMYHGSQNLSSVKLLTLNTVGQEYNLVELIFDLTNTLDLFNSRVDCTL